MKKFNIGDIVFVAQYYYKSGELCENHFLVIIDDGQAIAIDNYFGFLLTSNAKQKRYPYNKELKKNDKNNLDKDSVVKCDDFIEISEKDIQFKVGEVEQDDLERFLNTYMKYLSENQKQFFFFRQISTPFSYKIC